MKRPLVALVAVAALASALPSWTSQRPDPSHVFVIDSIPVPDSDAVYQAGLDSLLSLLARSGVCLYRSDKPLPWCDSAGLIGRNDVVLIKVNAAWPERGMTNIDLIKGLIARIVAHPDTFVGEVELVENGQGNTSWEFPLNNAERQSQTMQNVVDLFAGMGFHVGNYDWSAIGHGDSARFVAEFNEGDTSSGYVSEDSTGMTYPKFTTGFGSRVSTRLGVWNGSGHEPDRLKFINVPVLKSHTGMGVTAAIKHYIGFLSYAAAGPESMHVRAMSRGLLGVEFGKARFPDLNIIDATWVNAEISSGPASPYATSTRLNTLVASQDPVAADYYAGKHVLRPASWWNGHPWLHDYDRMDPDNPNTENHGSLPYSDSTPCHNCPYNAFHQMLTSSRDEMLRYGRQVTMDSAQITVHLLHFPGIEEHGREPAPEANSLFAAPNPTTGTIRVNFCLASAGPIRLALLTPDGRRVALMTEARLARGRHSLEFEQPFAAGAYLLTLEMPTGHLSCKVTVPTR